MMTKAAIQIVFTAPEHTIELVSRVNCCLVKIISIILASLILHANKSVRTTNTLFVSIPRRKIFSFSTPKNVTNAWSFNRNGCFRRNNWHCCACRVAMNVDYFAISQRRLHDIIQEKVVESHWDPRSHLRYWHLKAAGKPFENVTQTWKKRRWWLSVM